ncbi:hypothetical protein CECT7263_14651 [Bifidobacterium breve CECT 7263]|nr:hypothetical protein CECT7263_14651 [Bifidobacterium breve CECT 7263]OPG86299.1 hypothetical protein B5D08_06485 [Bifidobacterium breve]
METCVGLAISPLACLSNDSGHTAAMSTMYRVNGNDNIIVFVTIVTASTKTLNSTRLDNVMNGVMMIT